MTDRFSIAVVGGGIGGLSAALSAIARSNYGGRSRTGSGGERGSEWR
jgi:glycine/D-amino acid oxidase-like deaminating enzyme